MAERTPRFCFQNSCLSPLTSLAASSQDPARRVTQLAKGSRGARWRSRLGWNFVGDQAMGDNNALIFQEPSHYREARIIAGNYATGDDVATALAAAMNAAVLYGNSPLASNKPTMWLRAYRPRRDYDVLADGAALTAWQSWATGTLTSDASESTNAPLWRDAQVNGLPAVIFDGTNDLLTTSQTIAAMLGASGRGTIFLLVRCNSSGGATQSILRNATNNWALNYLEGSSSFRFTVNDGGTKNADKAGTQDAWHVITLMQDGTNIYIGVDDTDTAALVSTAAGAPNNTAEALILGGGGTSPLNGGIAEIVFSNEILTEAQRRRVHHMLSTRAALTDNSSAATWENTYTATYSPTTKLFTIVGNSVNWVPTTPSQDMSPEIAGDEACHADIGFLATGYGALSTHTGSDEATHSKEWIDVDLGAAGFRIGIFAGVNDRLNGLGNGIPVNVVIDPGIYDTPATLVAAVQAALDSGWGGTVFTVSWVETSNKLKILRASYGGTLSFLFATGADAGPEGATAHRTLGWEDTDVTLAADGNSTTADNETWGWNPTSTGIVIDHNSEGGGVYTVIADDQPIEGSRARGPNATSWTLRGDERIRIGQRGLYAETPVNLGRRYLRLLITDCENADAFNELSVLYLGPYLSISRSFAQGYEHTAEPLSRSSRSEDGSFFLERRQPAHRFTGDVRALTLADRTALEFMELVVGVGSPFFFLEDPQSKARIIDWTWYVAQAQPFQFRQTVGDGDPADRYETPVSFVEDLP